MNAANDGDVGVGFVLLEAGCDPDAAPVPTSRETALTIAAAKGYDKFVELLLQYNADINHRNKKGCTALFLAAENGHLDTVKVLVKNGADVDLQDNRKFLPLFAAFRRAHKEVNDKRYTWCSKKTAIWLFFGKNFSFKMTQGFFIEKLIARIENP